MDVENRRKIDLSSYVRGRYSPGRPFFVLAAWQLVNLLVIRNPFNPFAGLRRFALRAFGARIGKGVVLRPGMRVKFPWNLAIGDHSWIGEDVWIDNLASVEIGGDVCVSQGAYLCTGNHDWSDPAFGIYVLPIRIEDGAWVGARSTIGPGARIGTHAVIAMGSTVHGHAEAWKIHSGSPAQAVKDRKVS